MISLHKYLLCSFINAVLTEICYDKVVEVATQCVHHTEFKALYQHNIIVAKNRNRDVLYFPGPGKWECPYTRSVYHVYFIAR